MTQPHRRARGREVGCSAQPAPRRVPIRAASIAVTAWLLSAPHNLRSIGGGNVPDLSSALETVTRRTLPPRGNEGAARCSEDGPRRNGRVVIWAIVEQASRGAKPASLSAEALCALQQLLCRCCGRGAASFTTGVLPLGNADLIQGLTSGAVQPVSRLGFCPSETRI